LFAATGTSSLDAVKGRN